VTATTTGWFLVRWLAVAYAIESLMIAWLPVGAVGEWLGADAGPLAVPIAVAIGIPVYLNSFAAIPFVSGLIALGMSPATGLAFMLATSATGFPAMVAVWALVKPRAFALYLGFAISGAIVAGYAYVAAFNTYPCDEALQNWVINGYMLAWREHFLKDQEGEDSIEGGL